MKEKQIEFFRDEAINYATEGGYDEDYFDDIVDAFCAGVTSRGSNFNPEFYTQSYDGKEYLCRDTEYTDKEGVSHTYSISDDVLGCKLVDDQDSINDEDVRSAAFNVDSKFYCYAPVSVLLIKDEKEFQEALKKITELE